MEKVGKEASANCGILRERGRDGTAVDASRRLPWHDLTSRILGDGLGFSDTEIPVRPISEEEAAEKGHRVLRMESHSQPES